MRGLERSSDFSATIENANNGRNGRVQHGFVQAVHLIHHHAIHQSKHVSRHAGNVSSNAEEKVGDSNSLTPAPDVLDGIIHFFSSTKMRWVFGGKIFQGVVRVVVLFES